MPVGDAANMANEQLSSFTQAIGNVPGPAPCLGPNATVAELRDRLKHLGAPTYGTKQALNVRL
eukprot:6879513-Heterocapsa_arctica.AAC.1